MITQLLKLFLCSFLLFNCFCINATGNENVSYVAIGSVFNVLGIASFALACSFLKKYCDGKKNVQAGAEENQALLLRPYTDHTGCWAWMLLVAAGSLISSGTYLTTIGAIELNQ